MNSARLRFAVGEAEAEQRLDVALAAMTGISRAQAQRWIAAGRVRLNAGPAERAGQRLQIGDAIEATPPEPLGSPLLPEPIALDVLYEDEDLIAVNKAAGMVVHPAPGHAGGTLVNALLHHCRDLAGVGGVLRPGIVHRLDRGTSGVLVAAKCDAAHRALAEQFRDHRIERVYRALVRGVPGADAGRVDRPVGRHPRDRKRMSARVAAGREAHTAWRVLERFPAAGHSWLEVRPETGRTHQIRVHLASAGLPIAGDTVYGRRRRAGADPEKPGGRHAVLRRPALHAAVLGLRHPRSGEPLRFEAPLAADLAAVLRELAGARGSGSP